MPASILRITFSQTSGCAAMFASSAESSASPPVFSRWLWQVTQYLSTTERSIGLRAPMSGRGAADWGASARGKATLREAIQKTEATRIPRIILWAQ